MGREVFWDTSGLFALMSVRDAYHDRAVEIAVRQERERRRSITTEAVIGECCTLLVARGQSHLVAALLNFSELEPSLTVLPMDQALYSATKTFLRRHLDHAYSFVDCSSFVVMSLRRLREAATTDAHFAEAGFQALLR